MSMELFRGYGIPVILENEDSFLKVKETLTRIGIASKNQKTFAGDGNVIVQGTLYASCHILHKQGYYHILHFKELFMLDGRGADFSETDLMRRNTIALLLEQWGLLKIQNKAILENKFVDVSQIKILSHKEKQNWILCAKYQVGSKKNCNFGNK